MTWRLLEGDCRVRLDDLPAESVQTVVTSPPYFGLRDYGTSTWDGGDPDCDHLQRELRRGVNLAASPASTRGGGKKVAEVGWLPYRDTCGRCGARRTDRQLGIEATPDEYVAELVAVFRAVRRVLRDDGTVWLNLGDSYAAHTSGSPQQRVGERSTLRGNGHVGGGPKLRSARVPARPATAGVKPKDLLGVPWLVAFALRADGWYLRADVIWSKPNPMPESVTDRPTKAHEYLFLLAKSRRYYYDAAAIREQADSRQQQRWTGTAEQPKGVGRADAGVQNPLSQGGTSTERNRRSVWTLATQPYDGAHFATFPPQLVEPCVLAGSSPTCCGVCGAPWRRVVERDGGGSWHEHENDAGAGQRQVSMGQASWDAYRAPRTTGWAPTCDHDDDSGRSLVLDPFAGSGTVLLVAERHGRDSLGIELSPEYAALARRRIVDDSPLLNTAAEQPEAPAPAQLDLLDALQAQAEGRCIYCGEPTDDGSDEHESCWQRSAAAAVEDDAP